MANDVDGDAPSSPSSAADPAKSSAPTHVERPGPGGAADPLGSTVAILPGESCEPVPLATVSRAAYEVKREIARGGLGRILVARDVRLDRTVAIKELLLEHLNDGSGLLARFAREALLTARLQHPAIVPVYEAGLWPDGAPFYTMKLVDGKSLEVAVRE